MTKKNYVKETAKEVVDEAVNEVVNEESNAIKVIKVGDILRDEHGNPISKGCQYIDGKYYYTNANGEVIVIV